MKKRILDIGAGANPDIDATDAIDLANEREIARERNDFFDVQYEQKRQYCKRDGYCQEFPLDKPHLKNKIKFLYNIDYNKDKLPYPNNSIDYIISNNSLQAYSNPHTLKEIHRILKPGGYIDIGWTAGWTSTQRTKNHIKELQYGLSKNGFKNIKFFKDIKSNTLYQYQFTNSLLDVIRAYK